MAVLKNTQILRTIPLIFIAMLFCRCSYGKVIYVDDDANGDNTGTNWGNAHVYLQDALAEAGSITKEPVEVWVAQGIYTPDKDLDHPDGTSNRHDTFQLINNVIIKGGFAGIDEFDPNVRDIDAYETFLSGDLAGNDGLNFTNNDENSLHIVTGTDTSEIARLDGFTITGGYANFGFLYDRGGGMYNYNGSPTISNCTFAGNKAVCSDISRPTGGGGICNGNNSNPTLINCTFSENFGQPYGGGICNEASSNPTLINCTFSENSGQPYGGGMCNFRSNPKLTNCRFIKNSAEYGGGILNRGSSPTLVNCTFIGNTARCYGGGINNWQSSSPMLLQCTFSKNLAQQVGAGIFNSLYCYPKLTNCTFSGNSAILGGGGVFNDKDSGPTLINCILWDDSPNEIWNNDNASTITITYSNVQNGWPGEGNVKTNPYFSDAENGDYHLKSEVGRWDPNSQSWIVDDVTSPCIDAGDPDSPVAFEPFPNGGIINMGAYGGTAEASKSPSGLHAKYGGGTGEPDVPHLIYIPEHLNTIGAEPNDWDKHFKLMADINLSGYSYDSAIIAPDADPCDLDFQGTSFKGIFDGNGHKISNLTITGEHYLGLFGRLDYGAEIKNLGVIDVKITGTDYVAGIVGFSKGNITNSYCTGTVSGNRFVGGLTGRNWSAINASYNAATVTGHDDVGGLTAGNYGSITDSYSTGAVTADWDAGGLVGANNGSISKSYSTGAVSGDSRAGGLVGYNNWDYGVITSSFWDLETSELSTSDGGIGKTTAELRTESTFTDTGWDFVDETANGTEDIWWIIEGQAYPRLWWESIE